MALIDGKFCIVAENAAINHICGSAYTPAATVYLALSAAFSVVNTTYQWTLSGSGSGEYYLEAAGGGDPGIDENPDILIINGSDATPGTVGSLAAGEWGFGDNDSLGYDSIYVRLADDSDPNSQEDDYILAGGNPKNDGSGINEPTGGAYAPQVITFGAAALRKVVQAGAVSFPRATAEWGYITHWAVKDAAGGNILVRGALDRSYQVLSGHDFSIPDESIYIQIPAGADAAFSDYCVHQILNLMFRNVSWSAPATYAALVSADVVPADEDDTDLIELTGTDYARQGINPAGGASPAWTAASGGDVETGGDVSFGPPGADDWTAITGLAILTGSTGGKILAYDNSIPNQTPTSADTVKILAGGLVLSQY